MMRGIPEIAEVDEPDKDADDGNDFGEHVTKVVQFLLERRLLFNLLRDRLMNVAYRSLGSSIDDNCSGPSIDYCCTL